MPSRGWGWFWVAAGAALLLLDYGLGWFRVEMFGVHFPVGALAGIYGAMILLYYRQRARALELSPAEMEQHGAALERAVPLIVDLLKRKTPVREIASVLARQDAIPAEITYKYIIALGKEMEAQALADAPAGTPEDSEGGDPA